jgi:lipopolysaccharide biosynthesis glycosyltransferase
MRLAHAAASSYFLAVTDPIVIACASDERYVRPLAAMLRSAVDNLAPLRRLEIYVLHSGIDAHSREMVSTGWPKDRVAIQWVAADESTYAGLPLWGRMRVSTYFKLAVPSLLPSSVTRVIWLDCDLLVLTDLGELWDSDLRGSPVGAVQDEVVPLVSSRCGVAHHAELGIDASSKYFNAGVMHIDVGAWRGGGIHEKAIEYLTRYRASVVFWDQEGLNAVLAGKWLEIGADWNANASVPRGKRRSNGSPKVVHFAGGLKPWRHKGRDKMRSLYFDYLDRTAFAGWRPPRSVTGSLVSLYEESGLRSLLYPAENVGMRVVRAVSRG